MKKRMKKRKIIFALLMLIVVVIVSAIVCINNTYNKAIKSQENNKYEEALNLYEKISFYRDVKEKMREVYYKEAVELRNSKDFDKAIAYFTKSNNYEDSETQIKETNYQKALSKYNNGEFKEAYEILKEDNSYKDSSSYINNIDEISLYEGVWIEHWDEMLKLPEWQQYKNRINKEDCNILVIEGWNIKEYQIADWGDYIINGKRYNLIEGKTYALEDNFLQQYFMNEKYGTYFLEDNLLKFKNTLGEISYIYSKNSDDFNSIEVQKLEEPKIGMTKEEVLNSTWGKPQDINTTTSRYGTNEQWCYSQYRYIYFENGIVTSIQD
jgi:hypothetical protein